MEYKRNTHPQVMKEVALKEAESHRISAEHAKHAIPNGRKGGTQNPSIQSCSCQDPGIVD